MKGDQLKKEIEVHLHQSTSQVEIFSTSLMAKKDLLGELWTTTQQLLTQVVFHLIVLSFLALGSRLSENYSSNVCVLFTTSIFVSNFIEAVEGVAR